MDEGYRLEHYEAREDSPTWMMWATLAIIAAILIYSRRDEIARSLRHFVGRDADSKGRKETEG